MGSKNSQCLNKISTNFNLVICVNYVNKIGVYSFSVKKAVMSHKLNLYDIHLKTSDPQKLYVCVEKTFMYYSVSRGALRSTGTSSEIESK